MSEEELAKMEADWKKYRTEWIRRKKIFKEYVIERRGNARIYVALRLWGAFTDAMTPSETTELRDTLGIEFDSEEHVELEKLLGPGAQTSFRRRK